MNGTFGFSYTSIIYLLMLFIPNILWAKNKPIDYSYNKENKLLHFLEMIGQVFTTCFTLIFTDFNIDITSSRIPWLLISFCCMLLYEYSWYRYFKSDRSFIRMYEPLYFIPLPLATLPVAAFFLLGLYGNIIWLMISVIVLGIGHIGIHWMHYKEYRT